MTGTPTDHDAPLVTTARQRTSAWLVPAGIALLTVGLLAGLLLGRGMSEADATITDPVSVGFLQDMKIHHAQAVRMSEIVHRRSSDPALNYLAFDILSTQHGQIGIMSGWLDLSRQSQSGGGPTMAWMGHDGPMPGLASPEQIEELTTLPVPQMEEQYLRLMIEHHRGALPMASYAAEHALSRDVGSLAAQMNAGQASEIDLMQDLLVERGWAVEPLDGTTADSAETPADPHSPATHSDH